VTAPPKSRKLDWKRAARRLEDNIRFEAELDRRGISRAAAALPQQSTQPSRREIIERKKAYGSKLKKLGFDVGDAVTSGDREAYARENPESLWQVYMKLDTALRDLRASQIDGTARVHDLLRSVLRDFTCLRCHALNLAAMREGARQMRELRLPEHIPVHVETSLGWLERQGPDYLDPYPNAALSRTTMLKRLGK
jgi:hypothetical protein